MIDIQNITVQFGERKVLNDIAIQFNQGEMILIFLLQEHLFAIRSLWNSCQ